jgi:predicted RNase H-like HicB family nuclease
VHKVKIYPGEDRYWAAECTTLSGCISQGKTKAEARASIHESIEGYEAALAEIEADPKFIQIMKRSDEDIRAGRVYIQEHAKKKQLPNARSNARLKLET